MSDDPKLSQRYRELPREEPPRQVDDAILAASRRAVETRPAPLVAPTGRRRWYVPLAAAAVITLAVAVTLHVQNDRPGEEVDAVMPAMKVQETPKAEASKPAQAPRRAEERLPEPFASAPRADSAPAPAPAPAPAAAPAPAPAAPAAEAERKEAASQMAAASADARASRDEQRARTQSARVASVEASPEVELERIARLRAAGRHEEADRALAEFRKRYPDYRLSDEMKAKVERR